MLNSKDVFTGIFAGLGIAALIVGALYFPKLFSEDYLPPKQSAKFISVNEQSFRDWALRLNETNVDYQHTGGFRSQIATFPVYFKDVKIADTENGTRRVFGQFESFGSDTYEFFGKFETTVTDIRPVEIKVELFSGKVTSDNSSANRLSGNITIIETRENATIEGSIQMGSLNYAGLPFGATSLDFKGDQQEITAKVSSQVSGHQGTKLVTNGAFIKGRLHDLSGEIDISSLPDLLATIEAVASGHSSEPPEFLKKLPELTLTFQEDPEADLPSKSVKFDLKTDAFGNKFQSIAVLNKPEKKLKLAAKMYNFWIRDFPYGLQKVSGDITTQGIVELTLDQTDNEIYGPFSTKLEDLTLQNGEVRIEKATALVEYTSLSPLEIAPFEISSPSMMLDEPLTNLVFSVRADQQNLSIENIHAVWRDSPVDIEISQTGNSDELPDLYIRKDFQNTLEISDILGVALKFSGPIEFEKSWIFNGNAYESKDLSFRNTAPGILTLSETIPELRNLYIKDIELILEDEHTAALQAKGTNPLFSGDKPILIKTKLQRSVDD